MLRTHDSCRDVIRPVAALILTAVLTATGLAGCASSAPQTQQVVVADLDGGTPVNPGAMTREELEDHVRRFADRYITRVAIATRDLSESSDDLEVKRFLDDWRNVSYAAIVEVAIGADAVTSLMDMMVLTMLSRLVIDDYWAPRIPDEESRAEFVQAYYDLETDIWTVADEVLTSAHQAELAALVEEWHAENPQIVFPWYVRLSNFSGQRAASLAAVRQSGGMLAEVARAREAAEEIQAFGERVLFYLQKAPMITSGQLEASVNDVIGGPEIANLLVDVNRFVQAVDRLVTVVETLPGSQLTAVDQLMDRVAMERAALTADLASNNPEIRALAADLLPLMESIERTVVAAKQRNPDAEPFDIGEYRAIVNESAATAAELRLLAETIDNLVSGVEDASQISDALIAVQTEVVDRFFMRMIGFLLFFFVLLLASRFVWVRISPS